MAEQVQLIVTLYITFKIIVSAKKQGPGIVRVLKIVDKQQEVGWLQLVNSLDRCLGEVSQPVGEEMHVVQALVIGFGTGKHLKVVGDTSASISSQQGDRVFGVMRCVEPLKVLLKVRA